MAEPTQTKISSSVSILNKTFNQSQWVTQITELLNNGDLDAASQTPSSIFHLPSSICDGEPEAYLPHRIALGPYHHFHPDLYKMELYKLSKAKKMRMKLHLPQFHELVDELKPLELRIRASFEQNIEMDSETLLWIMLIDGLFLIELLHKRYSQRPLKLPLQICEGKLSVEHEILVDILKLENQIPISALEGILPRNHINDLASLLYQFCSSVSPFVLPSYGFPVDNLSEIYKQSHHLLNFLYFLILLVPDDLVAVAYTCCDFSFAMEMDSSVSFMSKILSILGSVFNLAFIQQLKEALSLLKTLFQLMGSVLKSSEMGEEKATLLIPSASELKKVGVSFNPTKNGILMCRFDKKTPILTLPSIHLDGFSRVLLRNLVAFEAISELNPPCLIQYIALMNGLVTSSKDVKILEEEGILYNHLNSAEEAVELFNGVKNSTRNLKQTPLLKIHLNDQQNESANSDPNFRKGSGLFEEIKDNYEKGLKEIAEEINRFYESCWRTKMKKFVKKYVCGFVMILAILVIGFIAIAVIARLICSFFSCPAKIFRTRIASDVSSLHMFV